VKEIKFSSEGQKCLH